MKKYALIDLYTLCYYVNYYIDPHSKEMYAVRTDSIRDSACNIYDDKDEAQRECTYLNKHVQNAIFKVEEVKNVF